MFTKTPWVRALNRAFIVGKVATNDVTLARFDTQDATKYPTGAFSVGTPGEVVKVSSFIDFPFITNVAVSGGDQQTTTFQPLQVNTAISLNTTKNPLVQTYTFTHDEEDPIRPILEDLDDTQKTTVIKFTNPAAASGKGEIRIYPAKVSFQKIPSAEVNNVETVESTLTMQSDMVIYRKDLVEALS
nr:MAG TPA: tail tube protein [Caudoviricetes sp.]